MCCLGSAARTARGFGILPGPSAPSAGASSGRRPNSRVAAPSTPWSNPFIHALPMFEPGYLVALIDLEEGIRLLSNLCEVELPDAKIGMPVEAFFVASESGDKLHQFRPIGANLG